jgi:xanthine/uracil permease
MGLVFGPLPRLHRLLVVATALTVGMLAGIWTVHVADVPRLIAAGLGWGLLAGLLLTYLLLHDFHHQPRPVRVRRH